MLLMVVCGALLAVGAAMALAWSGEPLVEPAPPSAGLQRRRRAALAHFARWAAILTVAGTATGLLVLGAGGRLAMRLLAATSPDAVGRFTEGQARVGDITLEGTLAYATFGALPLAFVSAALYLLAAPWLPRGRLAGATFGLVLLVVGAPFVDPLRADNLDFDLLGPGRLSVLVFAVLALLHGTALAAIAGRSSRALASRDRRGTAAALAPAVVLLPVGVVLALGGLVVAALPRALPALLAARASRRGVVVGRVLLGAATIAAAPAFTVAVCSIATR
jgi:hypothetical protein